MEGGILWNDPEIGIDWDAIFKEYDIVEPTLSAKDRDRCTLAECDAEFTREPKKYLITGYKGQLGYDIKRELLARGIKEKNILAIDKDEMDITNRDEVMNVVKAYNPDVIFHCAAWTAVDKAEDEKALCHMVNVDGTRNIVDASIETDAKIIYLSTDYVFDGTKDLSEGVDTLSGVAAKVNDGVGSLESGMGELKGGLNQLSDGASTLKDGTEQLYGGTQQLTAGTETLAAGSKKVTNGLDSLSAGTTELYGASSQLNIASNKIKDGAYVLKNGTADLAIGATKLYNGSDDLVNGITTLSDGTVKLADGSQTLVDGIKKFNDEGIDEICNLVNNEGKSLIKRIEKLEELSRNYTQFASDKTRDDIHFFNIMDIISTADTDKSKNNYERYI